MNTSMDILIAELINVRDNCPVSDKLNRSKRECYTEVIVRAKEIKDKIEKQQIIDAHEAGQILIANLFITELSRRGTELPNINLDVTVVEDNEVDKDAVKYYNTTYKI